MRPLVLVLLMVCSAAAQFRSTVPLVVAPTTVKNSKGRFVDGLTAEDLVLFDNNVKQRVQVDWDIYPISLVVAVETGDNSKAVLDKLGRSGILFSQLLAAEGGETAVISFSDEVKVRQNFTANPDALTNALRGLTVDGGESAAYDGIGRALQMLSARAPNRRRIILVIAEARDRHSHAKIEDVVREVQRQNAVIYWLTYSAYLTPFTQRNQKDKNGDPIPYDAGPFNIVKVFTELYHMSVPDAANLFAKATGARTIGFVKRSGLEEAIQSVGAEVHRQYIVTFTPRASTEGQFHELRVEVHGRPELQARTRAGYWTVQ
jgi:VWFA-related protein